jgi:DNA gyrase subunit B
MKKESFISSKTNWETTKRYDRYFYPDQVFYSNDDFSYDTLSARMRELSYLNKGITILLLIKRIR